MTTQTEFEEISKEKMNELFEIESFGDFVSEIRTSTKYMLAFDSETRVFRTSNSREFLNLTKKIGRTTTLEDVFMCFNLDAIRTQRKLDQLIEKEKILFQDTIENFKKELKECYEKLKLNKAQQEYYKNELFKHAYEIISKTEIIKNSRTDNERAYSREHESTIYIETEIFELNTTLKLKETPKNIIYDILKEEHINLFADEIKEIKEEISKEFEI